MKNEIIENRLKQMSTSAGIFTENILEYLKNPYLARETKNLLVEKVFKTLDEKSIFLEDDEHNIRAILLNIT